MRPSFELSSKSRGRAYRCAGLVLSILSICVLGVPSAAAPAAPVATKADGVRATSFQANWNVSTGADGYELDVWQLDEYFSDGDSGTNIVWSGDANSFAVLTDSTLPGGNAATDESFLGSLETNSCTLLTPSSEVNEWRFSLGTPDIDPSANNYFGVVLMSDAVISGDIAAANFHGYYLRVGNNGSPVQVQLWRSTGSGKLTAGTFGSDDFDIGGLRNGVNVRVTRDGGGVWKLWTSTGFQYGTDATNYCGSITQNSYNTSSYFGVYKHISSPAAERRVYIDNIELGARDYASGYGARPVSSTNELVAGLHAWADYAYMVRATNSTPGVSTNSNIIRVQTATCTPEVGPASNVHPTGFSALWKPENGALEYRLSVFETYEDFNDDFTAAPAWSGDTSAFVVTNLSSLPDAASAGSLDGLFDADGKATTDFGAGDDCASAAIDQPDGKIVVAGYASNGSDDDFAVSRYNADGSLDATFDVDGKRMTDFGGGMDNGFGVALQPDGSIVVAGGTDDGVDGDFALVRYAPDGSLDPSFGTGGKVVTDVQGTDDRLADVVIQPDGRILVSGGSSDGTAYDFALARYQADGSLDDSFDHDGLVTTDFGTGENRALGVAIQSDGKIVAAGYFDTGSGQDFALARYNTDGSPDATRS